MLLRVSTRRSWWAAVGAGGRGAAGEGVLPPPAGLLRARPSVDIGGLGWSGAAVLFLVLAAAVAGKFAGAVLPARFPA